MRRAFVNVRTDADFKLIVASMVAALRARGPYPILVLNGEQGSTKSTLARIVQLLLDPHLVVGRGAPRDERDLYIATDYSWILSFDNVSAVPQWLSDALCRISTGGAFTTRELHSNRSQAVFVPKRPIVLNGIPDLASRADLAERCLVIVLPPLAPTERKSESDFWDAFELERPFILGALFDAVAGALRELPETSISYLPRMADFASWVTAAERAIGWDKGAFMDAYERNRQDAVESTIESDPLAEAVRTFADERDWEGTPTQTLMKLGEHVSEDIRKSRHWPSVYRLTSRLRRAQASLRHIGIIIELGIRGGGKDNRRLIAIRKPGRIA